MIVQAVDGTGLFEGKGRESLRLQLWRETVRTSEDRIGKLQGAANKLADLARNVDLCYQGFPDAALLLPTKVLKNFSTEYVISHPLQPSQVPMTSNLADQEVGFGVHL
jgi:hypothetical protein